jgi:hypothetical protein
MRWIHGYGRRMLHALVISAAIGAAVQQPVHAQERQDERVRMPMLMPRMEMPGRAWLGFSFDINAESAAQPDGSRRDEELVTVREVRPGSPAEKGGVQAGDILLRVNGLTANGRLIRSLSSFLEPGDTVRVRVKRAGQEREFSVIAAERPANMALAPRPDVLMFEGDSVRRMARLFLDSARIGLDSMSFPRFRVERTDSTVRYWREDGAGGRDTVFIRLDSLHPGLPFPRGIGIPPRPGMRVRVDSFPGGGMFTFDVGQRAVAGAELTELSAGLGDYFGTSRGVLVLRVGSGTPAARAGLEPGDVVTKANGRDVGTIREFRREVAIAGQGAARLDVLRKRKPLTITIPRNEQ